MTTRSRLQARRNAQRTVVATQGSNLANEFEGWFQKERVCGYVPEIREPWLTTAGGKQAYQHLILRAADPNEPVLTIGWVNCALLSCKLRTHACMGALYEQRFGRELPIDRKAYRDLFESLGEFFETEGFHVIVENEPPVLPARSSRHPGMDAAAGAAPRPTPRWVWIALGGVLVAIGVGVARLILF